MIRGSTWGFGWPRICPDAEPRDQDPSADPGADDSNSVTGHGVVVFPLIDGPPPSTPKTHEVVLPDALG